MTATVDIPDDTYTGLPTCIQLQYILVLTTMSRQKGFSILQSVFRTFITIEPIITFGYFLKKF